MAPRAGYGSGVKRAYLIIPASLIVFAAGLLLWWVDPSTASVMDFASVGIVLIVIGAIGVVAGVAIWARWGPRGPSEGGRASGRSSG